MISLATANGMRLSAADRLCQFVGGLAKAQAQAWQARPAAGVPRTETAFEILSSIYHRATQLQISLVGGSCCDDGESEKTLV